MEMKPPPPETDVLCLRDAGRPPIVAALFKGEWFAFGRPDEPVTGVVGWVPLPPTTSAAVQGDAP